VLIVGGEHKGVHGLGKCLTLEVGEVLSPGNSQVQ
jgi:hypothetical protein